MKYAVTLAGVALALGLSGAAQAADYQRGDHRADRHQITRQQNETGRFDRNRGDWQNNDWRQPQGNTWRNDRVRTDFSRFRRNLFAPKRFRVGAYHGPRNYNYRRWSYGERLPFVFLARSYWLTNSLFYGLFAPPPGLIWVRYGSDALLVDQYTGEIVQVRYNVFY